MGVNLGDLVWKKDTSFNALSRKALVFDGNNMVYQFLSSIRQNGEFLRDSKGNITSHLSGIFYRLSKFLEHKIKLGVVFDGEPPEFKKEEIERRKQQRERYGLAGIKFDEKMFEESKELLEAMGIPVIKAPSEGEAQAAWFVKTGQAYGVVSQDYDSLLFGAKKVLRNYQDEKSFEEVDLQKTLEQNQLTQDQLILLAMLIGTDFNKGIKGIGPKKGLKLVKQRTPEQILRMIEKENNVDAWKIFEFFKTPPVWETKLEFGKFDPEKVRDILVYKHDFSPERVNKVIERVVRAQKEKTLEDFF
ncbi:MAG: flap structure-specific endonuclease [Candidatus Micrarchaeota archaeon]|nr:flap structure-specific endonuclease [Candidatus Micrarchaeota archaeon]